MHAAESPFRWFGWQRRYDVSDASHNDPPYWLDSPLTALFPNRQSDMGYHLP